MPIVICNNQHTPQGITNGAYATIVDILLDKADEGAFDRERHNGAIPLNRAPIVIAKMKNSNPNRAQLSDLPPDHVGIEPRSARALLDMGRYTDLRGKSKSRKRTVKFHQLPFSPAFAVTDYRSQGDTVPYVVVDLEPPDDRIPGDPARGYVCASRVTTKEGLCFLRDFPISFLRQGLQSTLKEELERQEIMQERTMETFQSVSL